MVLYLRKLSYICCKMPTFKQKKIYVLILALTLLFTTITLNSKFNKYYIINNFFNNTNIIQQNIIIPNIIHYVIFQQFKLNFETYLSILSSIKFQKPKQLFIHTDQTYFNGTYWDRIKQINDSNAVIYLNYLPQPTHVYGQKLSSVYHATDVARILVLQKWGGIYLDTDVLVLKSLDHFRHFEMVVGWPENEYLGTQILLAHKNARFLSAWLQGYKRYTPTNWYYNAGQYPTQQILEKMPSLAHRVKDLFGVQNLLHYLYNVHDVNGWKQFYTVHLLSRHSPAIQYFNESLIDTMNNTFGEIARYIIQDN